MTPRSLAIRLLLIFGSLCIVVLAASGVLLSALFTDYVHRSHTERLTLHLESIAAASAVGEDGALSLERTIPESRFEEPFGGLYWQIETDGRTLRSRSLWDERLDMPEAVPGAHARAFDLEGPAGQSLRAVARRLDFGAPVGAAIIAVAEDRRALERDIAGFNRLLAIVLGSIAAGIMLATAVMLRLGLRPLRSIGRRLAEIRSGRRERLDGAYPSEIQPLVDELNALVEHQASVVERARGAVANLAHGLKNPLSVLMLEAAGADGALADAVRRHAQAMQALVERYLARGRAVAAGRRHGVRAEIAPVLRDLERVLVRLYAERRLHWQIDCASGLAFRGDRQDLEEMLGNLLDNACKWAERRINVSVENADDGWLAISIRDDGPGIDAVDKAQAQERGWRLDEQVPGSGQGLAIVREIAELCGGRLALDDASGGGLAVTLTLPAAA